MADLPRLLPDSDHEEGEDCWCEVVIEYIAGAEVIVHRAFDGSAPPPELFEAIAAAEIAEDEE